MRIYARHKTLVNENSLLHQMNTLRQEIGILQYQLARTSQSVNETIAKKSKHELMHEMQKHQQRFIDSGYGGGQSSNSSNNISPGKYL